MPNIPILDRLKTQQSESKLPPSNANARAMAPYQQGAFDGFCGLYAIINALRLVARPTDGIGKGFCDDLFLSLFRHGTLLAGERYLIKHGTPRWLMTSMLDKASRHVSARSHLRPNWQPLLRGKGWLPLPDVLQLMREKISDNPCAFIVEIAGTHNHWTVIKNVTSGQVQLFDSDGLKLLRIREIRMSYDKQRFSGRHIVAAGSVFSIQRL